MEMADYLTIQLCDCGRSYCNFFSGSIGEYGTSFSEDELLSILTDLEENTPKVISHLRELLAKK